MKRHRMNLLTCAFVAALALQIPSAVEAQTEKILYSFNYSPDGSYPDATLIDVEGILYGVTDAGGTYGFGTAFAVNSKTGAETVLHSFGSGTDGQNPTAPLIELNGVLYGTTFQGGNANGGAVFAINRKTGAESVVYSFCTQQNCMDGFVPEGSLIDVKGNLYSTTNAGGAYGYGAIFAFDPKTLKETVVYSFCPGGYPCTDSANPAAALLNVNGTLYGTANSGGTNNYGTVFAFDPKAGTETVLYSFCSLQKCADGEYPATPLINGKGTLFGTTSQGGAHSNGVLFALDLATRTETTAYSFCSQTNCADGGQPASGLVYLKGILYGTTMQGGAIYDGGTAFSFDLATGAESVVYSFGNISDGQIPIGGLIAKKGLLYGTTSGGGTYGSGTVFSLLP